MSNWMTVSLRTESGRELHKTAYSPQESDVSIESLIESMAGREAIYRPFCVMWCDDTTDMAQIFYTGWNETRTAFPRDGDLWTADVHHGGAYEWHDNVSEQLPDWCRAGGMWDERID